MSKSAIEWRRALSAVTPVAVLGTLVCCAIPIVLIALGAGSVVASVFSSLPWLGALTAQKSWIFGFSALLLLANYWALFRSGGSLCEPGGVCHPSHPVGLWMRRGFWFSVAVYFVGFAATYLSLPLAKLLGY